MAVEITVPVLGSGMRDGLIAEWYAPDGAEVQQGEPLYRLESDFVAIDIEAEYAGVLEHRLQAGTAHQPGSVVALIALPEGVAEDAPTDAEWDSGAAYLAAAAPLEAPADMPKTGEPAAQEVHQLPGLRRGTLHTEPAPPNSAWDAVDGDQEFDPGWQKPVEPERDVFGYALETDDETEERVVGALGFSLGQHRRRILPAVAGTRLEPPAEPADAAPFEQPEPAAEWEQPEPASEPDAPDPRAEWHAPAFTAEPDAPAVIAELDTFADSPEPPAFPGYDDDDALPFPAAAGDEATDGASWGEGGGETVAAIDWDEFDAPVKDPAEPVPGFAAEPADEPESAPLLQFPFDRVEQYGPAEPAPMAAAAMVLRVTARMAEVRKMQVQLRREWQPATVASGDLDIAVRALARATMESPALRALGDDVGVVLLEPDGEPIVVLEGASGGPFRAQVERLDERRATREPGQCAYTVTSFGPLGIDDGTPPLPGGHPFALAIGATRSVFDAESGTPTPVLTLTLAYSAEQITVAQAAMLLAHVRDLMEAPHALLAD
ncbi:MAG: biotin/lipoyl-containing protein [Dehalococcoidia bacterium]